MTAYDNAHFILEAARHLAHKRHVQHRYSQLDEIHFYEGDDNTYTQSDVAIGNWNEPDDYHPVAKKRFPVSDILTLVADHLDRHGWDIDWDDNYVVCTECNRLLRSQPDSYGWQRPYITIHDGPLCNNCLEEDPDHVLDEYMDDQ